MSFDTARDLSALKPYLVQTEPNVLSSRLHPLFIESSMAQENVLIESIPMNTDEKEKISFSNPYTLPTLPPTHIKMAHIPFFLSFFSTHSHYLYFSICLTFSCHNRFAQKVAPSEAASSSARSLGINCTFATAMLFSP